MHNYIIADSGSTKCQWTIISNGKKKSISTVGMSPYFLTDLQMTALLQKAFKGKIDPITIEAIYFYGTGLSNTQNVATIKKVLKSFFLNATLDIQTDLVAAARATCKNHKGVACILGTGSNTGFYNGKKITKNSPGLGYVLGDEGSGAYLGKKLIQYYLYQTFDEELQACFEQKFKLTKDQILNKVYKESSPNKFLASFCIFLSEHRGHYMIENIIEDGLNDFFFTHLNKLNEAWLYPIHFVGSVAFAFRDIIKQLGNANELEIGTILKSPMDGLIAYHNSK